MTLKKQSEKKQNAKRSPKIIAQRNINNLLKGLNALEAQEENSRKIDLAIKGVHDKSKKHHPINAKRPRVLSPSIRPKLVDMTHASFLSVISSWENEIIPPTDGASDPLLLNTPIPTLSSSLLGEGNGPSFYMTQRHPFPGRVPSEFTRKRVKDSFRHIPETEWRSTPTSAVVYNADQYMLGNIAITDAHHLNAVTSKEMDINLKLLMKNSIGQGYWKDEVCSTVAQPLSSSAYCISRPYQVLSSAVGLDEAQILPPPMHTPIDDRYRELDCRKCADLDKPQVVIAKPEVNIPKMWVFNFSDEAHQAATLVQRFWRHFEGKRHHAATVIQTFNRKILANNLVHRMRCLVVQAVIQIQAQCRGRLGRRVLDFLRMALSYGAPIGQLKSWELVHLPANLKLLRAKQRYEESIRRYNERIGNYFINIQAKWRGVRGRRRAELERNLLQLRCFMALHLQKHYRGRFCRSVILPVMLLVRLGMSNLQAVKRGIDERIRYAALLALRDLNRRDIQRVYRGHCGRLLAAHKRLEHVSATTIIRIARGKQAREVVVRWKQSRIAIEQLRMKEEHLFLDGVRYEHRKLALEYLKTTPGKHELKNAVVLAKQIRLEKEMKYKSMQDEEIILSQAQDAFEMFDEDGSNEINVSEFRKIMSELCVHLNARKSNCMFASIDVDSSGFIDEEEFIRWYSDKSKLTNVEAIVIKGDIMEEHQEEAAAHVADSKSESSFTSILRANKSFFKHKVQKQKKAIEHKMHEQMEIVQHKLDKIRDKADHTTDNVVRFKLKSTKAMRDISGITDRRTGVRSICKARVLDAVKEAAFEFQRANPPDYWYHGFVSTQRRGIMNVILNK